MTIHGVFLTNGEVHITQTSNIGIATIRKLNKEQYELLSTGEIKQFSHNYKRIDNLSYLKKTFQDIEFLIKNNFLEPANCLWITMTYRLDNGKPMTDSNRLYKDFHQFDKGLNRYLISNGFGKPKWIYVVEPQRSGSWHIHLILDIGKPSKPNHPLIPNKVISTLWKQGFTKTKTLRSKDNISAYLSAYLTNDGRHSKKGSRLHFYPKGMRIYRTSRNLLKPLETNDIQVVQKKVGALGAPTSVSTSECLVFARGSFLVLYSEQTKYNSRVCNVQTRLHKHYYISKSAQDELHKIKSLNELPLVVARFLADSLGDKAV